MNHDVEDIHEKRWNVKIKFSEMTQSHFEEWFCEDLERAYKKKYKEAVPTETTTTTTTTTASTTTSTKKEIEEIGENVYKAKYRNEFSTMTGDSLVEFDEEDWDGVSRDWPEKAKEIFLSALDELKLKLPESEGKDLGGWDFGGFKYLDLTKTGLPIFGGACETNSLAEKKVIDVEKKVIDVEIDKNPKIKPKKGLEKRLSKTKVPPTSEQVDDKLKAAESKRDELQKKSIENAKVDLEGAKKKAGTDKAKADKAKADKEASEMKSKQIPK